VSQRVFCATGHRPDKLGGHDTQVLDGLVRLAEAYLIHESPDAVISGVALGWDTAWAIAALRLGIDLTAAVPFEGQESRWPEQSQKRYRKILSKAKRVEIVSEGGYSARAMQKRNEWMVDSSHRVVALWDGSSGGTGNCIRYAKSRNAEIDVLWDCWSPAWRDPLVGGVYRL